jgi:putative sigma-54 modulation protein
MRLQIRSRGIEVTEELRDHVGERVEQSLGRFVRHVGLVRVYLRDLNGPRGGVDKKCTIVVEVPQDGRVVVSGRDAVVHAAIAETSSRAAFAVKRHLKRRLTRRRRMTGSPSELQETRS